MTVLVFEKHPSGIRTLWKAFWAFNTKFDFDNPLPEVCAMFKNHDIDGKHLRAFNEICGIESSSSLQIMYPFTIAYPFILRVLSHERVPFSPFRVLHTRNECVMRRPITENDKVDLSVRSADMRRTEKGAEIDIVAEISSNGSVVWENTATYFTYLKSKGTSTDFQPPKLEPLRMAEDISQWYLAAENRFRFARISGDTNGLHYGAWYARLFGFKRDFAQPIRIVAKCVDELPCKGAGHPQRLTFFLKGPVYYDNMLTLKSAAEADGRRFDLYCAGNDRPCISGRLSALEF